MPTELPEESATAPTQPELPETLFLAPSRMRWIFTLTVSALIIALDVYLLVNRDAKLVWVLIVLFGIMGAMAAAQLIPGGAGLWLDRDGFTYRVLFFDRRRRWSEITAVGSGSAGLLQMVGYHKVGEPTTKPREVLPDTYGMQAYDLALLMNRFRERALG